MKLLLGALVAVVGFTACGTGSATDSRVTGIHHDGLAGRTFVSTTVSGSPAPLVAGTRLSMSFADGQLGASAGCNTMGGEYRLDGESLRLPGSLFMTEMACDEPRMEQDEWVSAFLGGDPSYELAGATLSLTDGRTTLELVDREVADRDRALVGTRWVLTGSVSGSAETGAVSTVPAGVRSTLQVTAGGRIVLASGCNRARGRVGFTESTVVVGRLLSTAMACPNANGETEDAVLGALQGTLTYSIETDSLSLQRGGSGLLYGAAGRH